MASVQEITALRAATGAGMMDCKKALTEANGDVEQAKIILRKQGLSEIKERSAKQTLEGHVGYYIHAGGKIGVLVEANCETDFVARSPAFQDFVRSLAMHVAASNPRWVNRAEVPQNVIDTETQIASNNTEGKPPQVVQKIVQGRLDKFYKETCLLEQIYIKDQNLTIEDLLGELVSKTGEKIVVRRFARFETGV